MTAKVGLILISAATTVGCSIYWWMIPYQDIQLIGGQGLVLVAITALGASMAFWMVDSDYRTIARRLVAVAPIIAVTGRAVYDIVVSPGSHSLFGLEMIVSLVIGALGVVVASVFYRLVHRLGS